MGHALQAVTEIYYVVRPTVAPNALKTLRQPGAHAKDGAPEGIRTPNVLIRSHRRRIPLSIDVFRLVLPEQGIGKVKSFGVV